MLPKPAYYPLAKPFDRASDEHTKAGHIRYTQLRNMISGPLPEQDSGLTWIEREALLPRYHTVRHSLQAVHLHFSIPKLMQTCQVFRLLTLAAVCYNS